MSYLEKEADTVAQVYSRKILTGSSVAIIMKWTKVIHKLAKKLFGNIVNENQKFEPVIPLSAILSPSYWIIIVSKVSPFVPSEILVSVKYVCIYVCHTSI